MKGLRYWGKVFVLFLMFIYAFYSDEIVVKAAKSLNGSDKQYNIGNLNQYYTAIDGSTVTSSADGRPKVLIFFKTGCMLSKSTFERISKISDYGNVDFVAIEVSKSSIGDVTEFKKTYGNNKDYIKYCYSTGDDNRSSMWSYFYAAGGENSITFPCMVYIDANNKVQYVTQESARAEEVVDNLNTYCNANLDVAIYAEPYKVVNTVSGIHVYWKAAEGAEKYALWYSLDGKTYYSLTETTATHYLDTQQVSGRTYYYAVSVVDPRTNLVQNTSAPVTITYVDTPDIIERMNLSSGIRLTWNKIEGAAGYAIYRKTGNESWKRVKTVAGNSTFTWIDSAVKDKNGTGYKYTVRALAGNDRSILSGCRSTGRTMVRLTSRTMTKVEKSATASVTCKWMTTSQATGYEVRFMVGNNKYKQFTIGNYKTGTKTFTGIKAGQTYKVQVRSYKKVTGVGAFYSAWSTPIYITM